MPTQLPHHRFGSVNKVVQLVHLLVPDGGGRGDGEGTVAVAGAAKDELREKVGRGGWGGAEGKPVPTQLPQHRIGPVHKMVQLVHLLVPETRVEVEHGERGQAVRIRRGCVRVSVDV